MEKPAAQNIQDAFLNSARRERIAVVIHLLQGSTFSGRIKSIGNVSYTYYSSFDRPEYRGGRKTGQQLQYINGIKFYTK